VAIAILDVQRRQWVAQERQLFADLRAALAEFEGSAEDLATLGAAAAGLDELFLLVIVGEFNSGKSALINALVGEAVAPEGVTPTTSAITVLTYGDEPFERVVEAALVELRRPAAVLREIKIVDTPGTNAVIRRHEELTLRYVPRSDLVLFVTSADRPFTESERLFLEKIRDWGKKVVFVLNKIDLLGGEAQVREVVDYVRKNAELLLGVAPEVFPVAARRAFLSRVETNPDARDALWETSRFADLERYVRETLDEETRLRLKLGSPLGVAAQVLARYTEVADSRLALLQEDLRAHDLIERQVDSYAEEIRKEARPRVAEVENAVYAMRIRGEKFFDETLRLGRLFDLFNAERVRGEFERRVIADAPQEIDRRVQEVIDWLVEQEVGLWRSVEEQLERRRQANAVESGGRLGAFTANRREVLLSIGEATHKAVETYDREAEAYQLAESVRNTVATMALTEAGAVGLGALVAIAATSAAIDVTGILAASLIAGLGLYLIPAKKRRALKDFRNKTDQLRERLGEAIQRQFETEVRHSVDRIHEALTPYLRFVRAERDKLAEVRERLAAIETELGRLRAELKG
jgi:small GTP-binding protein